MIELKLAAGRLKDQVDVIELIRANRESLDDVIAHLNSASPAYREEFERLIEQATQDTGR